MNVEAVKYVYGDNEELLAVVTQEFGELKISHWEEKIIGSFGGVEFKIPAKEGIFTKFIPKRFRLWKNGEIQEMPAYWRHGIFVKHKNGSGDDVLVTRCYYHANNEKTFLGLPFGKKVLGTVEIRKATNTKTGEVKIILNFIYSEKVQEGERRRKIAIDSNSEKSPIFRVKIPNTGGKEIRVFNI